MTGFPEELRPVLRRLAEEMIPAGEGLPSAAEVCIHTTLLDDVLKVRPDLAGPLERALRPLADLPPGELLAALETDREGMATAGLVVAGGYLMSAQVAEALKYPFQEAKIVRSDELVRDIEAGLLDSVIERGPIYRLPGDAPEEAHRAWQ